MPNGAADGREQQKSALASKGAAGPPRILLACMPKSGSTFLSDVISALPDFKRAKFALPLSGGNLHELDEGCLRRAGSGSFVGQVHVLYSERTAKICDDFRLKPVVLVRSLPDAIVSLRDHVRREGGDGLLFGEDPHYAGLDDASLEAMLARFSAPWYVNFYMSWRSVPGVLMISYEQLTAEPERTLRRIVDFAGAAFDDRTIARAISVVRERRESRLNVGSAGRGATLQPEVLRDLVRLFDFFPEAANDPYVKGVRAQVEAALGGRPLPPIGGVAVDSPPALAVSAPARPTHAGRLAATARRYGYQVTLIGLGVLYWIWPDDLIPDDQPFGRVDDVVFLIVLAFLAGRITKRTPRLRDLPSAAVRMVGRRLRFNG